MRIDLTTLKKRVGILGDIFWRCVKAVVKVIIRKVVNGNETVKLSCPLASAVHAHLAFNVDQLGFWH